MARAGLRALEYYDPATQKHGQAHMQARWGRNGAQFLDRMLMSSLGSESRNTWSIQASHGLRKFVVLTDS